MPTAGMCRCRSGISSPAGLVELMPKIAITCCILGAGNYAHEFVHRSIDKSIGSPTERDRDGFCARRGTAVYVETFIISDKGFNFSLHLGHDAGRLKGRGGASASASASWEEVDLIVSPLVLLTALRPDRVLISSQDQRGDCAKRSYAKVFREQRRMSSKIRSSGCSGLLSSSGR